MKQSCSDRVCKVPDDVSRKRDVAESNVRQLSHCISFPDGQGPAFSLPAHESDSLQQSGANLAQTPSGWRLLDRAQVVPHLTHPVVVPHREAALSKVIAVTM